MPVSTSAAARVVIAIALNLAGCALIVPAALARTALTFRVPDTSGVVHTEAALARATATVVFFITPGCPISQGYVPEMNRISADYAARGVRTLAVQTDPAVSTAELQAHVRDYGYRFPVLIDRHQRLVAHVDATVTPEAAILSAGGTVLYRGRIDNRVPALGVKRVTVTEFDLRDALDAVVAGRAVPRPRTTASGCFIQRL